MYVNVMSPEVVETRQIVFACEGSLRSEWSHEVWVRWELNCTACLCPFVKALVVQRGVPSEDWQQLVCEHRLEYTQVFLCCLPQLQQQSICACLLSQHIVADLWVRAGARKSSSWHPVWLLTSLSSVCTRRLLQWTASLSAVSDEEHEDKTRWRSLSKDSVSMTPSNL